MFRVSSVCELFRTERMSLLLPLLLHCAEIRSRKPRQPEMSLLNPLQIFVRVSLSRFRLW